MQIGKSIPALFLKLPKKVNAPPRCCDAGWPRVTAEKGAFARTGRHIPSPADCQPFFDRNSRCQEGLSVIALFQSGGIDHLSAMARPENIWSKTFFRMVEVEQENNYADFRGSV
jgi:hypothetical protein